MNHRTADTNISPDRAALLPLHHQHNTHSPHAPHQPKNTTNPSSPKSPLIVRRNNTSNRNSTSNNIINNSAAAAMIPPSTSSSSLTGADILSMGSPYTTGVHTPATVMSRQDPLILRRMKQSQFEPAYVPSPEAPRAILLDETHIAAAAATQLSSANNNNNDDCYLSPDRVHAFLALCKNMTPIYDTEMGVQQDLQGGGGGMTTTSAWMEEVVEVIAQLVRATRYIMDIRGSDPKTRTRFESLFPRGLQLQQILSGGRDRTELWSAQESARWVEIAVEAAKACLNFETLLFETNSKTRYHRVSKEGTLDVDQGIFIRVWKSKKAARHWVSACKRINTVVSRFDVEERHLAVYSTCLFFIHGKAVSVTFLVPVVSSKDSTEVLLESNVSQQLDQVSERARLRQSRVGALERRRQDILDEVPDVRVEERSPSVNSNNYSTGAYGRSNMAPPEAGPLIGMGTVDPISASRSEFLRPLMVLRTPKRGPVFGPAMPGTNSAITGFYFLVPVPFSLMRQKALYPPHHTRTWESIRHTSSIMSLAIPKKNPSPTASPKNNSRNVRGGGGGGANGTRALAMFTKQFGDGLDDIEMLQKPDGISPQWSAMNALNRTGLLHNHNGKSAENGHYGGNQNSNNNSNCNNNMSPLASARQLKIYRTAYFSLHDRIHSATLELLHFAKLRSIRHFNPRVSVQIAQNQALNTSGGVAGAASSASSAFGKYSENSTSSEIGGSATEDSNSDNNNDDDDKTTSSTEAGGGGTKNGGGGGGGRVQSAGAASSNFSTPTMGSKRSHQGGGGGGVYCQKRIREASMRRYYFCQVAGGFRSDMQQSPLRARHLYLIYCVVDGSAMSKFTVMNNPDTAAVPLTPTGSKSTAMTTYHQQHLLNRSGTFPLQPSPPKVARLTSQALGVALSPEDSSSGGERPPADYPLSPGDREGSFIDEANNNINATSTQPAAIVAVGTGGTATSPPTRKYLSHPSPTMGDAVITKRTNSTKTSATAGGGGNPAKSPKSPGGLNAVSGALSGFVLKDHEQYIQAKGIITMNTSVRGQLLILLRSEMVARTMKRLILRNQQRVTDYLIRSMKNKDGTSPNQQQQQQHQQDHNSKSRPAVPSALNIANRHLEFLLSSDPATVDAFLMSTVAGPLVVKFGVPLDELSAPVLRATIKHLTKQGMQSPLPENITDTDIDSYCFQNQQHLSRLWKCRLFGTDEDTLGRVRLTTPTTLFDLTPANIDVSFIVHMLCTSFGYELSDKKRFIIPSADVDRRTRLRLSKKELMRPMLTMTSFKGVSSSSRGVGGFRSIGGGTQQLWGTLEPTTTNRRGGVVLRYAHYPPGRGKNIVEVEDNGGGIVEPFGFGCVDENGVECPPIIITTTSPSSVAAPPPPTTSSQQQKNPRRKMMTPITTAGATNNSPHTQKVPKSSATEDDDKNEEDPQNVPQPPTTNIASRYDDDDTTTTLSTTMTSTRNGAKEDAMITTPLPTATTNNITKEPPTTNPVKDNSAVSMEGLPSEVASSLVPEASSSEDVSTTAEYHTQPTITTTNDAHATQRGVTATNVDTETPIRNSTTSTKTTVNTVAVTTPTTAGKTTNTTKPPSAKGSPVRSMKVDSPSSSKPPLPHTPSTTRAAVSTSNTTPVKTAPPTALVVRSTVTTTPSQQPPLATSVPSPTRIIRKKRKCRDQRRPIGRNTVVSIGPVDNGGAGCGMPMRGEMIVPVPNNNRRPQKPSTANTKPTTNKPHQSMVSTTTTTSALDRSAFYVSNPLDCDTAMFTSVMRKMRSVSPLFRFASWEVLKRLFDRSQVFLVCCTPPPQQRAAASSTTPTNSVFQFHPPPTGLFYVTIAGHTELPPITSGWQKLAEFVSSGPKARDILGNSGSGRGAPPVNRNSRLRIAPKMKMTSGNDDVVVTPTAPQIFRKSAVDETTCTEITRGEVVEIIAIDENTQQQQASPLNHHHHHHHPQQNSSPNSKPTTANSGGSSRGGGGMSMTRSMRDRAQTPLLCRAGTAFWTMSEEAYVELSDIQMAATQSSPSHFVTVASGTM